MLDFNTVYKNQNEQLSCNRAYCDHTAIVLSFPNTPSKTTKEPISVAPGNDIIDHRMKAPLSSSEMTALWDMVKYRAKHLGQELWVTTGDFLATMGTEELGDLRRCDFVRAVEYLVAVTPSTQA